MRGARRHSPSSLWGSQSGAPRLLRYIFGARRPTDAPSPPVQEWCFTAEEDARQGDFGATVHVVAHFGVNGEHAVSVTLPRGKRRHSTATRSAQRARFLSRGRPLPSGSFFKAPMPCHRLERSNDWTILALSGAFSQTYGNRRLRCSTVKEIRMRFARRSSADIGSSCEIVICTQHVRRLAWLISSQFPGPIFPSRAG